MENDIAIEVNGICKSYKNANALTDITLKIHKGEIFGLIGPDGASKTTLFRVLTTLTLPDSGSASVNGRDVMRSMVVDLHRLYAGAAYIRTTQRKRI